MAGVLSAAEWIRSVRACGLAALCAAALLAGVLLPAGVATAQAPPAGSFSVVPTPDVDIENPKNPARERLPASRSWFTFRAEPGQVIRDSLRIVNTGQVPLSLLVYPVDATTGATTGMVMHNQDAPRRGVGTWVQISQVAQPSLRLEPGAVVDVEFTVGVPAGASPGEHWGGLMVEDTNVRRGSGQFTVNQVFRAGVALGVTLPGPRIEKLTIRGLSSKILNELNQVFVIDLANEGNVLVKSRGVLELKDVAGNVVARHELTLDNVLPGTSVPFELIWPKENLPAGKYQATVNLTYSPTAAPALISVPDLAVEAPGMRLAAPTPVARSERGAVTLVPAGTASPPAPAGLGSLSRLSGLWQTLFSALAGATVLGGTMLAYRFLRRPAAKQDRQDTQDS